MTSKFAVFSLGTAAAFFAAMPANVKTFAFIALMMVIIDTISGVFTAIVCKEVKSCKMRTHLVAKTIQYTILTACAFTATIAFESWFFVSACFTAIVAIEASSMIENLVKLQEQGGANLGPAARYVHILGQFFEAAPVSVNVITTATVLPTRVGDGEIITSTSVDNISRKSQTTKDGAP
jgi:phage-related holin